MFTNLKNFLSDKFGYISKPKLFVLSVGIFCIVFAIFKINSSTKPNIEELKTQIINIDSQPNLSQNTTGETNLVNNEVVQQDELEKKQEQTNKNKKDDKIIKQTKNKTNNTKKNKQLELENNNETQIENTIPNPAVIANEQASVEEKVNNDETENKTLTKQTSREVLDKIVQSRIKDGLKKSKSSGKSSYNGAEVLSKSGKYKLQLLAYSSAVQAKNYAVKIKKKSIFKGHQIFVVQKNVKGKKFYAVQIGVFKSKSAALSFCSKIKSSKTAPSCFVVAA